jgi:hypothetical protein
MYTFYKNEHAGKTNVGLPDTVRNIYMFWRVNVLYFVGIGSQPQETWRHRKLTVPEVVTHNHDGRNQKPLSLWQRQYGGPNNNMAAK